MRILHVISSLDPKLGGPPAVAARLAAAQAALGHDVSVLCYSAYRPDQSHDRALAAISGVPHVGRVRVTALPPATGIERAVARSAAVAARGAVGNVDVMHLHGVWEPMLARVASAARRRGVPYVVRPAGMLDIWSMRQRALKKKFAMALVYRRMLNSALFVHALNQDEAANIGPLKLTMPVRVIPNGVFLEELEPLPAKGSFYENHPALAGRPFVLFLSRLHFKKGLDYLAEAFAMAAARVPDLQLVVAGPDDGYRAQFEQLVLQRSIAERTHVIGPLYGRDKLAALVDAACFCLPSRQEGFSVAITEALACGLPVVVSRESHFPEVTESGAGIETGLDGREVGAALLRVLSDPALRLRMSAAGAALVRERFTWPRIAARCVEAYRGQ